VRGRLATGRWRGMRTPRSKKGDDISNLHYNVYRIQEPLSALLHLIICPPNQMVGSESCRARKKYCTNHTHPLSSQKSRFKRVWRRYNTAQRCSPLSTTHQLMPRPFHPQRNLKAQNAFKKTAFPTANIMRSRRPRRAAARRAFLTTTREPGI
jgi:hypothetical protein